MLFQFEGFQFGGVAFQISPVMVAQVASLVCIAYVVAVVSVRVADYISRRKKR